MQKRHSRMLLCVSDSAYLAQSLTLAQWVWVWVSRTIDLGSWRERRIMRQSFGSVMIGAVDVCIFLLPVSTKPPAQIQKIDLRWSERCTAS